MVLLEMVRFVSACIAGHCIQKDSEELNETFGSDIDVMEFDAF